MAELWAIVMATLKEFEEALRQHGMTNALAILDDLKTRDRARRSVAPARRVVGRKMTAELARTILDLHATTGMTQQEIAFKLGVNQGRVNEVIKRGKWLSGDPHAPEALSRDKAMDRLEQRAKARRAPQRDAAVPPVASPAKAEIVAPPPSKLPLLGSDALPTTSPTAGRPQAKGPIGGSVARPSGPRPRAPETGSAPIVSAQLAFLDL